MCQVLTQAAAFRSREGSYIVNLEVIANGLADYIYRRSIDGAMQQEVGGCSKESANDCFNKAFKFEQKIGSRQL